jgi:ABC-type nitrate/sulfonate/bicarbonate transport system substrate-binding protein
MVNSHRSGRMLTAALMVAGLMLGACSSAGDGGSSTSPSPSTSPEGSQETSPSGTSPSGGSVTTISLVYDWSGVDFEAVPLAVAKSEGMFAKAGIDVDLILPPDDSTTVKLLGSGQGDIGFATTADVVITRGQGADVVSIGNYSQVNNWGLIARPGEKIDLTKLKGAKIGVFADNWTQAMMPFVLKAAGLGESDVQQVIFSGDDVAPLLANKLDLTTNTTNFAVAQVQEAVGKKPTVMLAKEFGAPDIPVWVYVAGEKWLEANGDTAKAFLVAIKEATQWAIDNPDAAVTDFERVYPDNGSSHEYNLAGWQATAEVMTGPDGLLTQRESQWSELTDALTSIGALDSAAEPSTYYTNDYLPE